MQSNAKSISEYIAGLPEDRRKAIETVRKVVLKNLGKGFEERMNYGMIGYVVPHSIYPAGYHCDPKLPLPFAGLASQKNYMSLYLMTVYGKDEKWFREQWAKTGKKLDMGKCCVRFKSLDDLPLELIGEAIRRFSVPAYIQMYETGLQMAKDAKAARQAAKSTSTKRTPSTSTTRSTPSTSKTRSTSSTKRLPPKKTSPRVARNSASKSGSKPAQRHR